MHEFGHFIDLPQKREVKISKNKDIKQTFEVELEAYKKQSTKTQQDYIKYLIHPTECLFHISQPLEEALGDAEMSLFAGDLPLLFRMRLLEYQANFPELIAKFINACDEQAKCLPYKMENFPEAQPWTWDDITRVLSKEDQHPDRRSRQSCAIGYRYR